MSEKKVTFPIRCKACKYYEGNMDNPMCCYCANTGEPRGCPIDRYCIRFEAVNRKKTKTALVAK